MANAQWTQLGPGAGGQERAVFLYNNPYTGLEDLYVGSDVSGVWRAPNINAADISNPLQYDYTYISNNELFRFVNKFVNQPSYPNILFVGNRGGIDIVDMANTNASVQKLWDMPDAWVSDIHVIGTTLGGSHTIFATTGSTRIQDEPNNNKNNTTIADLYEFTWNGSATTVTTAGYQLDGLSGDQDVYCMFVDESPVYDIFLLGTETGLFQFTQTQIASTIYGAQIAGPNNVGTNYKVTSITREGTSDFYLVTLYDQGLWEYNSSTKAWTNNLITHLIGEDENSSNTVTTKDYANDYASYSFTRLLQLNGTNPGWVLLNEEQTYDNHYVGVFYSEDNGSGVPTGNWRVLNTYTGSNDWGWNNAKPCGNINSALITTDNKLLIGKSGNIFITKNPITNITPLNVAWQQIYSRNGVGNNGACADSYKNMGYVNYAAKAVYHDAAGVTWIAQADRLMFYSNQNTDFYQPIDKATNSSCSNVDLSGNFSYPNCVGTLDKNLPLSDCFFITEDPSNDIWAGMGSGFASKKGYGFVVKRNNSNDWKREGDAICGDPQKIFFVGTDKYLLVNEPGGGARIHKLNGTSWGPPMEFWGGTKEELQDAIVSVNDNMLYVIRKNIPEFEIVRIDLTVPSVKTTNTILNTNQVPLRLAIMPYSTNDYKIIVGCGPKNSTSNPILENLKETYIYTNSSTTYTYNGSNILPANPAGIFNSLHFDALDNTDHGITGICIDKDLGTIYVSTVKMKSGPLAERSHIYRGTYNTSNGNIDMNWTEITGQLPNKAIKFMTCKGNTICNEQIYCCVRGLGAWRWNASAVTFTGITNISCPGNINGQATAVAPAIWTGTNTYTWSNGATTAGVANLAAGTYTVTVTNILSSCSSSGSLTITTPVLTIAAPAAVCNLATNGIATALLSPPNTNLNYAWSNSQTTASATGLSAGTYTVTVSSFGGGCISTISASVTIANSNPTLSLAVSQPACNGTTGIIKCTGGAIGPFQYKWSNQSSNSVPYQTSNLFSNLTSGTYTVTVSDFYGCTASSSKTLTDAQQLATNYSGTTLIQSPIRWDVNTTTINSNAILTLVGLNLFCTGGSSTIIVSQGGTLNITNCNISACGDMWQGIINNGGTVNITNSSTIEDAIEAVHNQNNGILNITNNTFNGNNTDLFLDAGSYSTSKITGNTFTNAAGPLTKAPYAGIAPAHHIRLNNATNLVIGGNTVADKNTFNRNLLGILAVGSSFDCFNNTFNNIGSTLYAPINLPSWTKLTTCAAINANASLTNNPTIKIGDINLTYSNTFNNCDNGIVAIASPAFSRLTLGVCFNNFDNCKTSIYTRSLNGSPIDNTLNINNNSITKTPLGGIAIRVDNLQFNTVANINNNMINQNAFYDPLAYGKSGIDVQNYLPVVVRLTVSNNNSRNVATSIMLRNLIGYAKCGNGGGQLNVFENTIDITKPIADLGTQIQTGINVQNCQMAQLYNNNPIKYTQIPDATILDLVTGINIEGSYNITLSQNKTENCGRGVSFKGLCTATKLFCNTMTNCWRGAYLDGTGVSTSISDQGDWTNNPTVDVSWGNKWDNNDPSLTLNDRVDGSGFPVGTPPLWLYDVNDVAPFMFRPVPSSPLYITPTAVNNTTTDCTAPQIVSDILRERNYGRTVRDSTWADPDSTYFEITNEDAFFDAANADSTILYQNNNKDAMYQNKYNQLNTENEGRTDDAICNYVNGDSASAATVAATIDASNLIGANKQFVLEVILAYNNVNDILDTTIIEQLYAIAYTHPFYGGEAVYWARAFLHLDVVDEMPQIRKGRPNIPNQNVLILQKGKLLPNPARDYVQFNYEKSKTDNITLEIFDCIGNKINVFEIENTQTIISTSELQQSVYFIHVYLNGINTETHKLILIK